MRSPLSLTLARSKARAATLQTRAGNDYDQASLLLALLRAAGIPARYMRGVAIIPVAQVQDWLGLRDAAVANTLLNTAGISATPVVDGGGAITVYRVDRVWVMAFAPFGNYRGATSDPTGPIWAPLDPAFKLRDFQPGIDGVTAAVAFDEDDFLSEIRSELPADFYRDQVMGFFSQRHARRGRAGRALCGANCAATLWSPARFPALPTLHIGRRLQ